MRSSELLVLPLLAVSAWAAPGPELGLMEKRATCNADNCLRAVRATSAKPFASSATADCSSFMRKTVTPCPVTTTSTVTATSIASPTFVTVTGVVNQTQLNTVVQTLTSVVTTIVDTATIIQPSEVDVTNTIFSVVTVTQAAAAGKRGVNAVPLPPAPTGLINAREVAPRVAVTSAAATCAATTGSPSSVPTYASACSGTARYSSACSCAGVTGSTTTLVPVTSTATSTVTTVTTPTSTVTATAINTVPVTVTQTQIVPTTFETTDATAIVPSLFTVTTNVVVPTTVAVAPPVCSSYKFVVTNGARAGQFVMGAQPDPNAISYGFLQFTADPSAAQAFTVRQDGRVYGATDVYGWITKSDQVYFILQMTGQSESFYGSQVNDVFCSIGNGDSPYPGAVGTLTCRTSSGTITVSNCSTRDGYVLQYPGDTGAGYGCTPANLAAVLAC